MNKSIEPRWTYLKEIPLEVHARVSHAIDYGQLLEIGKVWNHGPEVEVVDLWTIRRVACLSLRDVVVQSSLVVAREDALNIVHCLIRARQYCNVVSVKEKYIPL